MARFTDADIYAAAARYGREGAAHVLGVSASWVGKRSRQYAAANAVPVPVHASSHPRPVRVRKADPWSHRRVADGGSGSGSRPVRTAPGRRVECQP